jgi:type II secretory pathway pseudopilin PulG
MNGAEYKRRCRASPPAQQGAALLITLALVGIIAGMVVLWAASSAATDAQRVQDTARAMGMIRDALVARAAGDLNRPGSLPCPDVNNDGQSTPVPDWSGSACASYIGRVPWKTLDLPDLRDADGERFWYALSPVFRDSPFAGTLNSDTAGSLTVTGTPAATNVVAIILAPGTTLSGQDRDPANTTVATELPHYLDGENNDSDTVYEAGPETSTFNDKVLLITRDGLMPSVEQRVARQARRCLETFAASNGGRYPFAAQWNLWPSLAEVNGALYGRIPSTLLSGTWPPDNPDPGSGTACFAAGTWWDAWRELLLYRVSAEYAPTGGGGPCGTCLRVNGPGGVKFVIMATGRALQSPTQAPRVTNKTWPQYYLERYQPDPLDPFTTFDNASAFVSPSGLLSFGKAPRAVTTGPLGGFNDRVECVHETGLPPCN